MSAAPPRIFDRALLRARLARAARLGAETFLLDRAAEDLADRLGAVNRRFETALDLGTPNDALVRALKNSGQVAKIETSDTLKGDEETFSLGDVKFDLVVSALALQWVNDLPGALLQIRRALKPDGLLLAALIGGETLHELRESFATAEWAAIDYLWGLACDEQMFLFRKEDQSFHVSPDIHRRIYNRHRLEVSVRQILEAANDPDAEANSRTWMRHHLIGGRIPWTIAGEGGDDFKQLRNRIDAILKMTRTYAEAPIVDDLCGLAVEEWRDELVRQRDERDAKARQKLDEVMEARKRRLRDLATRALKEEASGWLESQSVGDIPLLDWASESDDRYWKGFELIGRAENARKTRILAAEAADDIRKRLTAASNTAFRDPARSHLFLHSAHPKLAGRRPIEACSTEADLRIALALLPKN